MELGKKMKCLNTNCNNEFESKGTFKKFCCDKCRSLYRANKYYQDNKDNPEYKEKKKKTMANYLLNNKQKHNEDMKLLMREKLKNPRYVMKQKEYSQRPEVIERKRKYALEYYYKKKEMGGAI